MASNLPFVQEIDFKEIELQGVVGKGTYGTVRKGKWQNLDVAVKIIETEQEKKAFIVEVQQLSRVDHVNIVKLYGACTKAPVCLVMEYAEGGSLYNVLHCMKQIEYTAAHALSWLLQTANGVAYLHNMKPRPLIHRDLKPPNLLLINGGTVVKICDFGTACDKQTHMTDSKGSAAWMAPEVFEGNQYSEKCDVFSWGIILWEVLTRRKPFSDGGNVTALRILWAVHNGKRPPLIQGCPRPLENLMKRCWAKNPSIRPSMNDVQNELSNILKYMKGVDEPIDFSPHQAVETDISVESSSSPTSSSEPKSKSGSSCSKTVLPDEQKQTESPSENAQFLSVETAGEKYVKDMKKRRSADFTNTDISFAKSLGHRRSGSCDSPYVNVEKQPTNPPLNANIEVSTETAQTSDKSAPYISAGGNYFFLLEQRLQPVPPVQCPESIEIYEKHLNLARELFQYRNEIAVLLRRRNELLKDLQTRENSYAFVDECIQLRKEKESLLQLRQNLKRQLEIIQSKQQEDNPTKQSADEWVVV